jgi:hypothetical protein
VGGGGGLRLSPPDYLAPFDGDSCPAQMSAYVVLGVEHPSRAVDVVMSLLRMQAPSTADGPGLCAVRGLTANGKVALEAGLQLGVGVLMVAVVVMSRWALPGTRLCRRVQPRVGHALEGLGQSLLLDNDSQWPGERTPRVYSLSMSVQTGAAGKGGGEAASSPACDGTKLSPRVRYITAAVNFCVTAYSTVTVATIKMVHCVRIPGTPPHERRLFIRGSVVCDYSGWQLPYMVVLAALLVVPVMLPLVAAWSRRTPASWADGGTNQRGAFFGMQSQLRPPSQNVHAPPPLQPTPPTPPGCQSCLNCGLALCFPVRKECEPKNRTVLIVLPSTPPRPVP